MQSLSELLSRAQGGDATALGRLLSRAEAGEDIRDIERLVYGAGGRAHIVGITGVPGAGKSSLVSRLLPRLRADGRRVAVLALDPVSPLSGGALLGDRIRMGETGIDPGIFIRSMASRGAAGGLALSALCAVDVLDVCGFDMIVIETVGAGQEQVDIARAAHTAVLLSPAGLGDDVQALKAGLLEVADIHVVSQCDRPGADRTRWQIEAFASRSGAAREGWTVPVLPASAETGEGIDALVATLRAHRASQAGAAGDERLRRMAAYRARKGAEEMLHRHFDEAGRGMMDALIDRVARREMTPYEAASRLLAGFMKRSEDT